jgi:hypothetical protein
MNRARVAAVLAMLVMAVVVAGCNIFSAPSADKVSRLKAMPEASMAYPGSVQLSEGSDQGDMWAQTDYQRILGTQATVEEVHAYLSSELASRGWSGTYCIHANTELTCFEWTKADLEFRLGFWDPKAEYHMLHDWPSQYATIYQVDLLAQMSGWSPTPLTSGPSHTAPTTGRGRAKRPGL